MAKQFAFNQLGRQRCTIQGNHWFVAAVACFVYGQREKFFSRSGFPTDKDSGIGGSNLLNSLQSFNYFRAFTDNMIEMKVTNLLT